jgi:hypothetical protein
MDWAIDRESEVVANRWSGGQVFIPYYDVDFQSSRINANSCMNMLIQPPITFLTICLIEFTTSRVSLLEGESLSELKSGSISVSIAVS